MVLRSQLSQFKIVLRERMKIGICIVRFALCFGDFRLQFLFLLELQRRIEVFVKCLCLRDDPLVQVVLQWL